MASRFARHAAGEEQPQALGCFLRPRYLPSERADDQQTTRRERFPLCVDDRTNLYEYLQATIDRDWQEKVAPNLRRSPNFEEVLYCVGRFTAP